MTKAKSLLDPSFVYTPSTSTNLRKTFARVRRELRKEAAAAEAEAKAKVAPLFDRRTKS
jgi:hypothetical protein